MEELDNYECFGVPAHVWVDDNAVVVAPAAGTTRRHSVHRECAMLGIEALPSPLLTGLLPAG